MIKPETPARGNQLRITRKFAATILSLLAILHEMMENNDFLGSNESSRQQEMGYIVKSPKKFGDDDDDDDDIVFS
jgi:hypothetical protein